MNKLKTISVNSMDSLSREEMAYITDALGDIYYTSCKPELIGAKCVYDGKSGICDYTALVDSSGNVLYYDVYCNNA